MFKATKENCENKYAYINQIVRITSNILHQPSGSRFFSGMFLQIILNISVECCTLICVDIYFICICIFSIFIPIQVNPYLQIQIQIFLRKLIWVNLWGQTAFHRICGTFPIYEFQKILLKQVLIHIDFVCFQVKEASCILVKG